MIRTRFAPSPTGYLHIGSLRTALFDYLFARNQGGVFVLRIEDTDRERFVPDATEKLINILKDFGLEPDEGPHKPNPKYAPYVQSERLEIYKQHALELVEKGDAYYCFCTASRLEEVRKMQEEKKLPPRYDGHCRSLSVEEVKDSLAKNAPYVVRHKTPRTGLTEYDDLVYGHLQFKNELLDDSILMKTDGYPVYNFANVVDDHLMDITHVIRGEEFLSSTPKHVLLYKSFGWPLPVFCHLPLILDTKRQKLSKRSGDVAVEEYLKKGYLKEAIMNFIAFLGWNPKSTEEMFSLEKLVAEFSFEKVNKAGAIFDITKLDYLNRQWQKKLALAQEQDPLFARTEKIMITRFPDLDIALLKLVWPQILERIQGPSTLEQQLPEFDFYFARPDYEPGLLVWKKNTPEQIRQNLLEIKEFLSHLDSSSFEKSELEKKVKEHLTGRGVGLGDTLWPLRVALSGRKESPSPFEIAGVLVASHGNAAEVLARIDAAIKCLGE